MARVSKSDAQLRAQLAMVVEQRDWLIAHTSRLFDQMAGQSLISGAMTMEQAAQVVQNNRQLAQQQLVEIENKYKQGIDNATQGNGSDAGTGPDGGQLDLSGGTEPAGGADREIGGGEEGDLG